MDGVLPCQGEVTRVARICAFIPTVLLSFFCSLYHSLFLPPLLPDIGEKERRALQGQFALAKRRMKFVFIITIQSWATGHRVTTEKEIENDRYRNEGGPVQSGTKQSESPNPCNLSMARLVEDTRRTQMCAMFEDDDGWT